LLDAAVFPGIQGGPLEHVIAGKAIAFGEALNPSYTTYMKQVQSNAALMAEAMINLGYHIVSGGTNNHSMLIDLRNKGITGKDAEIALGNAHITVNKNMVPFDTESPFVTSGIRLGTAAITSRGINGDDILSIVSLIDATIQQHTDEGAMAEIRTKVEQLMGSKPLFAW